MNETEPKKEEEKAYKTPVLFLRKSKAGEHLYAFNIEKEDGWILGGGINSLLINVSDVVKLVDGKIDWIKVSVISAEE